RKEGRAALGETESQGLLQACGFSVAKGRVIHLRKELRSAAEEFSFPVVLKIVSPDILHKTDAGGVVTGIRGPRELEEAYDRLLNQVRQARPAARIQGVLIQEMAEGLEVILGANRDPHFGPLLLFGLGGVHVQALRDVKFRRAP